MVRLHHKLPNSWAQLPRHREAAVEEFILGDTTAGEFNCTKHETGSKKLIDETSIETGRITHKNWPFQDTISVFGANFADRWPRWTGARLIKVHLHSKSFGGGGGSKMAT